MGIYSDGKIYGVAWFHSHNESIEPYTYKGGDILTDEERQEIHSDFLRLIPEKERSFYRYSVYSRCFTTYDPNPDGVFSYSWMWFPLEVKYLMEYFDKGTIVGF